MALEAEGSLPLALYGSIDEAFSSQLTDRRAEITSSFSIPDQRR